MSTLQIIALVRKFLPVIKEAWPHIFAVVQGVKTGADVSARWLALVEIAAAQLPTLFAAPSEEQTADELKSECVNAGCPAHEVEDVLNS